MSKDEINCIVSDINRALGMIEGASYSAESPVSDCLVDAVQIIDSALEELKKYGK